MSNEMSYSSPTTNERETNREGSHKVPIWVVITAGLVCAVLVLSVLYLIYKRFREKMQKCAASPEEIEKFHIPTIYLPVPPLSSASSTSSLIEEIYPQGESNLLDPNIYLSYEGERLPGSPYMGPGRLCFSVNYDKYSERLRVQLIRATRLTPKGENVTATPYVKICLLPDKRQRVQSRVQHRTSNPEFFEDFVFIVPERDLHTRTLKFTVCDYDRFSRQQVIGHVMYNLTDTESLMDDEDNEIWMDVSEEDTKQVAFPKGEILFSLQFLPTASRLTIAIVKAKDLNLEGEHGELNPYVKISMIMGGKPCRKKKTAVCKRTNNPVYNEAFVFTIPPACMERVSFVISVINAPRLKGNKKLIGRSIVGPYMYSTGEGLEHWKDMISSARSKLARWHTLI